MGFWVHANRYSSPLPLACALLNDRTVKCWGDSRGLGDGLNCALLMDKTVKCWGGNVGRQLGHESAFKTSNPISINDLTNVAQITLGFNRICALVNDGTAKMLGAWILWTIGQWRKSRKEYYSINRSRDTSRR